MDAPLSQWGENSCNPWANEDEGYEKTNRPIAVMVDNFATVTGLLRGLFAFSVDADGFILRPQLPDGIETLSINEPYFMAGKDVYISYSAKGGKDNCRIGDMSITADENGYFHLTAAMLEKAADDNSVFITFGEAQPCKPQDENNGASVFERDALLMREAAKERLNLPYPKANFRPFYPAKCSAVENMLSAAADALAKRKSK